MATGCQVQARDDLNLLVNPPHERSFRGGAVTSDDTDLQELRHGLQILPAGDFSVRLRRDPTGRTRLHR